LKRRFSSKFSTQFYADLNEQKIGHFLRKVNVCGESDQLIVHFSFAKNGGAKRSKEREAKLRVKIFQILIFEAKLCFALFASLRSAIFSETEVAINWSLYPQGLNWKQAMHIPNSSTSFFFVQSIFK